MGILHYIHLRRRDHGVGYHMCLPCVEVFCRRLGYLLRFDMYSSNVAFRMCLCSHSIFLSCRYTLDPLEVSFQRGKVNDIGSFDYIGE